MKLHEAAAEFNFAIIATMSVEFSQNFNPARAITN